MKKILSWLIIFVLMATPTWSYAASYYGCASAAINADSTFCATPSGSCAGSDPVTAATALAGTHNLYANGCTISFADANFTANLISTEDGDAGGPAVEGGGFTLATGTAAGNTYTTAITAGSSDCLTISGNGAGTPVNTIIGAVTGGAAGADGIYSTHTVGTIQITGALTGGSVSSASAVYLSTTTGIIIVTGNATGVTSPAFKALSTTNGSTINGDCIGSNTAADAAGCNGGSSVAITVTGNIVNGTRSEGARNNIIWSPSSAQKSIKTLGSGTALYSSAGLGSDAGGTQVSAANTAAEIKTTSYFVKKDDGVYTQGTATSTGGGAYAY